MRLAEYGDVDKGESQHMAHIRECVDIIAEVEANKKGTSHEKVLDENEKYKLSLFYMQMLEDPKQFAYLERFLRGEDSKLKTRMNLKPADVIKYRDLLS